MFGRSQHRTNISDDDQQGLDVLQGAYDHFEGAMFNNLGFCGQSQLERSIELKTMPYIQKTGVLQPNNIIFICGVPKQNARRFTVYLQNGSTFEPAVIAFCVDARFDYGNDRCCVVRNHKHCGWGMEERKIEYFPFKAEEHFEMIILIEHGCFKVAVNNTHMLQFNHRIQQLDRVNTIRIDGDVTLTQVRIQT